jgi:uncharacterized protein
MWRLIFIGLIVWFGIYIFKRSIGQSNPTTTKQDQSANDENIKSAEKIEDMVQCATCAVHLPRSEAFMVGGRFYCSQAHIQRK